LLFNFGIAKVTKSLCFTQKKISFSSPAYFFIATKKSTALDIFTQRYGMELTLPLPWLQLNHYLALFTVPY
jgi:hypothetical protein